MMDIQKEREAFEEAMLGMTDGSFNTTKNHLTGQYTFGVNQTFWAVWQAAKSQAVPEGFVLMPIKPTETMVMAVVKEHEGDAFLPYSLYDAYVKQAMIEAQEQSNE